MRRKIDDIIEVVIEYNLNLARQLKGIADEIDNINDLLTLQHRKDEDTLESLTDALEKEVNDRQ